MVRLILKSVSKIQTHYGLIPGFVALSSLNEWILRPKLQFCCNKIIFWHPRPGRRKPWPKFCDINKIFGNMASPPRAAEVLRKID
jgi:hypothetical protein